MPSDPIVEAQGLAFSFADSPTLDCLSFSVDAGAFVSFLGPSGCGKTTLLNLIAGIYRPQSGQLSVRTDRISFVFQNDTLLSWRTVLGNVLLPFELAGAALTPALRARGEALLAELGLGGSGESFPSELSGGMKKRVEIARALVTEPELLILDEPFSSLDIITREKLNVLLRDVHHRTACSAVMVTHSVEEACFLSDRVFVLSGRPARIIGEQDLSGSTDAAPDQYLLSAVEREAAGAIRTQARALWSVAAELTGPGAGRDAPGTGPRRGEFFRLHYGWLLIPVELVALYFLLSFLTVAIPIPEYILPRPWGVLQRFATTLWQGTILPDLGMTVYESLVGFLIGFALTLALGYGIAKSRLVSRLLMPYLIASNTIPSLALAPFLVLWFGFGVAPRIIISVIVIFFPMLVTTISAIGIAEKATAQLSAFFRPRALRRFLHFELPASLPMIASGVKVSITLSVIGAVVGEFVSGNRGLGALVSIAKANFDVQLMFVGLIWLIILGLVYYSAAALVHRLVAGRAR